MTLVCRGSIEFGTACGECPKCRDWLAERYPGKTFEQVQRERSRVWLLGDAMTALSRLETAYDDASQIAHIKAALSALSHIK
jgi:hypothetical protein